MTPTWLSDDELADATRRRQPAAQARVLTRWGVPFRRRPDGTLLVVRTGFEGAVMGAVSPAAAARDSAAGSSKGIRWSKPL